MKTLAFYDWLRTVVWTLGWTGIAYGAFGTLGLCYLVCVLWLGEAQQRAGWWS